MYKYRVLKSNFSKSRGKRIDSPMSVRVDSDESGNDILSVAPQLIERLLKDL